MKINVAFRILAKIEFLFVAVGNKPRIILPYLYPQS